MTKYRCKECGEVHLAERLAVECCGSPYQACVWRCPYCSCTFDDLVDATNCCYSYAAQERVEKLDD